MRFGELLGGLDLLKEPKPRGGIRYIGGLGGARTAGDHAANAATDVSDDGSRITSGGESVRIAAVWEYRPLHGGLIDRVEGVLTNDREDAVRAAEGGAGGIAALDDQ